MFKSSQFQRTINGLWLETLAAIVVLAPSTTAAQERVSKPGFYSGYSRILYTEVVHNSRYLTMRDGTKLAATIYRQ